LGFSPSDQSDAGWIVTVFDNNHNSFEEVIMILLIATQCSMKEAEIETWEVHNLGRSVVHHGSREECERAAAVISQIKIAVKVSKE
jgi:ATP-dependent Clp protease adapter protein ClpS